MLGLLLLLLGCLPCAEALSEDDHSKNQISAVQTASQADIHAVLRDMTAVMTEQRVELRHTQQELKAAVDRLKDSESLVKALQVDLQQTQKEQSSTQQELRAAMERLTNSDRLIKASVETIGARSNATQQEVHVLQKHNEVGRVAFSASLLASGRGYTGPYNVDTILIYRHVITNVGNGYKPGTGSFVAPVKGVYQFNIFIHGHGGPASHASAAKLFKNGQWVFSAAAHQPTNTVAASNGASLLLEAEDVVYVKLWNNKRIYDDRANYNTFSGHLLFTM